MDKRNQWNTLLESQAALMRPLRILLKQTLKNPDAYGFNGYMEVAIARFEGAFRYHAMMQARDSDVDPMLWKLTHG